MAKILVDLEIRRADNRDGIYVSVFIPRKILVEANFSTTTDRPDKEKLIKILENSEYQLDPLWEKLEIVREDD